MYDERNTQQPPENPVKLVEPLEAAGRDKILGAKNTDKCEKALTGGKHHHSKDKIGNRRVKNQLVGEEIRFSG